MKSGKQDKQGIIILRDVKICANKNESRTMKKGSFRYAKLTNQLSFKSNFQKVDQHSGAKHQKGKLIAKPETQL